MNKNAKLDAEADVYGPTSPVPGSMLNPRICESCSAFLATLCGAVKSCAREFTARK